MAKDLQLKILINAQDNTGAAFGKTQQGLASLTQQIEGIKNRLSGLLGLSVADILLGKGGELAKAADLYKNLEARLKLVSDNTKEFATAQTELFNISQGTRASLEGTTTLYIRLESAIKQLGGTQETALATTETVAKAIALTGGAAETQKAGIEQFNQALASGVLRGQEFNSVMLNTPGLAQAIADGLGVTVGQLRAMAEAGELTADRLVNALGKVAPSIAEKFKQLPLTIGGAMTQLNNAFIAYVGNADKASGASAKLAGVISGVATNLTTIGNAALFVAVVYSGKFVSSLAAVTAGYIAQFGAETSARASTIALAQANVALAVSNTRLAEASLERVHSDLRAEAATLAQANATRVRARAEIATLRTSVQTTEVTEALRLATVRLTEAEAARGASLAHIATLGSRQVAIAGQLTAAQTAQTDSTVALTTATTGVSVAMARISAIGKSAFAFIGGWVGAAVIALYLLYEALVKITGSEEKAAIKAKALADALELMNKEVKQLSAAEVDIDFDKTTASIDEVQKKIKTLETFSFGKLFNVADLVAQRDHLLQTLDVLKQRKDALVAQKNEQIINFDASTLSAEQLTAALADTKLKISEISNRIEPLKQQVADGFIGSEAINSDLLQLNAYQQKLKALEEATGGAVVALKAADTAYKEFFTTQEAKYQREAELLTQREQQQIQEIERSVAGEKERALKISEVIIQSNTERIRQATELSAVLISKAEDLYNKERATAVNAFGIEQALLAKKIEILKVLETATKAAIDKMISDEQRHVQAAQAAAEARKNLAISTEEAILGFLRESMNEQEKAHSIGNEQEELDSSLRKARAAGDFEEQQRISKRLMELAVERGHVERQIAEKNGHAVEGANAHAVESYRTAAQAGQDALKGMQTAEEAAAGKAHAAAEKAQQALQDVQARLGKLQSSLSESTSSTHTVTDNVGEVSAHINSLNGQNTSSTHTINTVQAKQHGGPILRLNSGGKLSGYGGGDTVPAMLEPGEFVMRKEAVDKYGAGLFAKLNAMNVNVGDAVRRRFGGIIPGFAGGGSVGSSVVDLEKERRKAHLDAAAAKVAKQKNEEQELYKEREAIKAKILPLAQQAQLTSFGGGSRVSSPYPILDGLLQGASEAVMNGAGAMRFLNNANGLIELLIKNLHFAKKKFEDLPIRGATHLTLSLAAGGGVPGVGDADTVPAMLTPGEWVINKSSVAKFGNTFMDAVNRGVLPQGFNSGGQVGASSGGNVVVQFKAPGGQSAQAEFGSQSDVNQFLEVIRLSGGVTK